MFRKIYKHLKQLGVLTALAFPVAAIAQSDEGGTQQPSPCVTNVGPNGELFEGYFGFVSAPAGVHTIEISNDSFFVDPLRTFGTSLLIYPKSIHPKQETQPGSAELRFFDEDSAEIYSCTVKSDLYDFDRDGVEGLSLGVCPELKRPVPMAPAQVNVFNSKREIGDQFVNSPQIADGSSLGPNDIVLIAKSVGVVQFLIFEDISFLGNQRFVPRREQRWALMASCPVLIVPPDDPRAAPDVQTCLLENGEPARARVGQTVTLQVPLDPSVEYPFAFIGTTGVVNSRTIDFEHDRERRTFDVNSRVAAKYDFLFRSETGDQDEICMLIVDP